MLRSSRFVLWIVAVAVGAYLLVCIAVNLWLQSSHVQNRLRDVASEALDTPVTVGRTYFLPWSGITLKSIQTKSDVEGQPRMSIHALQLRIRLLPLLRRNIVISDILLNHPRITWAQSKNGKWGSLPHSPNIPDTIEVQPLPAQTKVETERQKSTQITPFQVQLGKVRFHQGEIILTTAKGEEIATFQGIQLETTTIDGLNISGEASIREIAFSNKIVLNEVRGTFNLKEGLLTLSNLKAKWAKGRITGSAEISTTNATLPFHSNLELEGVALPNLLSDAGFPSEGTEGRLNGKIALQGLLTNAYSLEGEGNLDLAEGRMSTFEVLRLIGSVLGINELQELALRNAALRYQIKNQQFVVDDLTLKSENLILKMKGHIQFNKKIKLNGRFIVNESIFKKLGKWAGQNFSPSTEQELEGFSEIDFQVTGRTDSPQTNLIERITGMKIGRHMRNLLPLLLKKPTNNVTHDESSTPSSSPGHAKSTP